MLHDDDDDDDDSTYKNQTHQILSKLIPPHRRRKRPAQIPNHGAAPEIPVSSTSSHDVRFKQTKPLGWAALALLPLFWSASLSLNRSCDGRFGPRTIRRFRCSRQNCGGKESVEVVGRRCRWLCREVKAAALHLSCWTALWARFFLLLAHMSRGGVDSFNVPPSTPNSPKSD